MLGRRQRYHSWWCWWQRPLCVQNIPNYKVQQCALLIWFICLSGKRQVHPLPRMPGAEAVQCRYCTYSWRVICLPELVLASTLEPFFFQCCELFLLLIGCASWDCEVILMLGLAFHSEEGKLVAKLLFSIPVYLVLALYGLCLSWLLFSCSWDKIPKAQS